MLVVDSEEGYDFKADKYQVVTIQNLGKSITKAKGKPFHWAVRANSEADLDAIAQIVLDKGRNLVLCIDEISDWSTAQHISPTVRQLIRKARKRGITAVCGSQRAPGFNRWILSNSAHTFIFFIKPDDRKRLKDYYSPETIEAMDQLGFKRFDFLYIGPDGRLTYFAGTE